MPTEKCTSHNFASRPTRNSCPLLYTVNTKTTLTVSSQNILHNYNQFQIRFSEAIHSVFRKISSEVVSLGKAQTGSDDVIFTSIMTSINA